MSRRRWLIAVGLAAFVIFTAVHGFLPWNWSGQTAAPPGVAPQNVTFQCGPPMGSSYIRGGTTATTYPLPSKPCGQRTAYKIMTMSDFVLGVIAIALVVGWDRVRRPATQLD